MKWKETKFKKFLDKAGSVIANKGGDVVDIALKAATGDFSGAIGEVGDLLGRDKDFDEESSALYQEFKLKIKEFEIEQAKIEAADRDSARKREVEIAKAGGQDIMMIASGAVALFAFLLVLVTVLFIDIPDKNEKLVYHVLGITEGVAISVFTYYFGSSKGSSDKQKELMKK